MKHLFSAVSLALVLALSTNIARADDAAACEAKAVSKSGKPLAGAAKDAFIKKCVKDAGAAAAGGTCEERAVGKNGKALAGAAKDAFMKKCMADSK